MDVIVSLYNGHEIGLTVKGYMLTIKNSVEEFFLFLLSANLAI